MKKHKPQKFGLNPKWVQIYIIIPMTTILTCAVLISILHTQYITYAQAKSERESLEKIAEESRIAKIKADKEKWLNEELARLEKQRHQESLEREAIEVRKRNTLYENEISKKYCPIGTYILDKDTGKVGQANNYNGLRVLTNGDVFFDINEDGTLPDHITFISAKKYSQELEKQIDKSIGQNKYELEKQYKEWFDKETAYTKSMWMPQKYNYVKYKGEKYIVRDCEGGNVILKKNRQKQKIKVYRDDKELQKISIGEYLIVNNEK